MQPDRENAECDDAGVEVAAHLFFASLSRGLLRERCESPLGSRLGVQWHLTPIAHRAAIYARERYVEQHRCDLSCFAPSQRLALGIFASVLHAASPRHVKTLAAFPGQPPPWQKKIVRSAALSLSARLDLCFLEPPR